MRKSYFLFSILLCAAFGMQAQNSVTVDASAEYIGYANVFETPANGEAFVFGDSWAVEDLKTVIDPAGGTITLQPNFNAYDAADPFWVDPATGLGNKFFEGNTFIEDASLVGSELTFSGGVASNDLDPSYETMAFIKVFNADFSVLKIETAPLVAGQNFSITYANVEPEDAVVQYGFSVYGRNANPDDEATLGSVVVVDQVLGVNEFDASTISTYPNPATDVLNVSAQEQITAITIYNMLGQQVIALTPDSNVSAVNVSTLRAGVYMAQIATATGSKTVKFVKR
ncbi:MAG: T9SS type A sorting domain-containing protein [Marinirhabdus sp.]|nr:T9SS type A sorting domain-containing protein [Marinirhabdus sp.]